MCAAGRAGRPPAGMGFTSGPRRAASHEPQRKAASFCLSARGSISLPRRALDAEASGAVCSGTARGHPPPRPSPSSPASPSVGHAPVFPPQRGVRPSGGSVTCPAAGLAGGGAGARLQAPGVEPSGTHFWWRRNGGIQGSELRSLNDLTVQFNSSTNISSKTLNKDLRI